MLPLFYKQLNYADNSTKEQPLLGAGLVSDSLTLLNEEQESNKVVRFET